MFEGLEERLRRCTGFLLQQGGENFLGVFLLERLKAQLRIITFIIPLVPILWPIIDQQNNSCSSNMFTQEKEKRLEARKAANAKISAQKANLRARITEAKKEARKSLRVEDVNRVKDLQAQYAEMG